MARDSRRSRVGSVIGLAALCMAVAGCSGGTPLRFALSSINGVAFSPRKDDGGRPVPNADVSVFQVGANGALSTLPLASSIKTDSAGTFSVRDILTNQLVLIRVVGVVPTAQDVGDTPVTVTALVPIPPPATPDQTPPPVATRVDLVSDLAAGAALRLLADGTLQPGQINNGVLQNLEGIARQVAMNNCLLPGQSCTGASPAPSQDALIDAVVESAVQTPGTLTPPETGGVGVIVR
jgi:hypothetical protein